MIARPKEGQRVRSLLCTATAEGIIKVVLSTGRDVVVQWDNNVINTARIMDLMLLSDTPKQVDVLGLKIGDWVEVSMSEHRGPGEIVDFLARIKSPNTGLIRNEFFKDLRKVKPPTVARFKEGDKIIMKGAAPEYAWKVVHVLKREPGFPPQYVVAKKGPAFYGSDEMRTAHQIITESPRLEPAGAIDL